MLCGLSIRLLSDAMRVKGLMKYYSWCNQVLWSPQLVWKNTSRRRDLWLEVGPPIGGGTSNQRCHLQSEVRSPIGGETSNWRWDLQFGGVTSNWRWDLQSEVTPPIRGGLCMWGHTGAPMLHVGINYSFEKKERLFIVDYIKPSPVYQVKCKLVNIRSGTIAGWSQEWVQVLVGILIHLCLVPSQFVVLISANFNLLFQINRVILGLCILV